MKETGSVSQYQHLVSLSKNQDHLPLYLHQPQDGPRMFAIRDAVLITEVPQSPGMQFQTECNEAILILFNDSFTISIEN
jgi:hypothetical protein